MYSQIELKEIILKEINWEEQYLHRIESEFITLPKGHMVNGQYNGDSRDYHVQFEGKKRYRKRIPDSDEGRLLKERLRKKRVYRHDRVRLRNNLKHLRKVADELQECTNSLIVFPWETVELQLWLKRPRKKSIAFPENLVVLTKSGEMVRSKSEAAIYDELAEVGEYFRYEDEIVLPDGRRIYPDFLIVRKRDLKPFLWEHMGALHIEGKAARYFERIHELAEMGFYVGNNLILTWEDEGKPFTSVHAKSMIEKYLL